MVKPSEFAPISAGLMLAEIAEEAGFPKGVINHVADLPTTRLRRGDRVDLTFYWPEVDRWEGNDFVVCVE